MTEEPDGSRHAVEVDRAVEPLLRRHAPDQDDGTHASGGPVRPGRLSAPPLPSRGDPRPDPGEDPPPGADGRPAWSWSGCRSTRPTRSTPGSSTRFSKASASRDSGSRSTSRRCCSLQPVSALLLPSGASAGSRSSAGSRFSAPASSS
jgi:hypothetical protein